MHEQSSGDGPLRPSNEASERAQPDSAASTAAEALTGGVDCQVYDLTSEIRRRGSRPTDATAGACLAAGNLRDELARARDAAALTRDQNAGVRDLLMAARAEGDERFDDDRATTGAAIVLRAAANRKRAAQHRAHAAEQRSLAAVDRDDAARERVLAAQEGVSTTSSRRPTLSVSRRVS